ncbi:hypothetical protein GCM10028895_20830 [Pontibacter rugosus]
MAAAKLEREIQFEQDEKWREQLLNLDRGADKQRLQQLLRQQPVLVLKDELPKKEGGCLTILSSR